MLEDKCFRCENVPCVDLFIAKGNLRGGELYVLNQEVSQKKVLPCMPGCILYACCKLWTGAHEVLHEDEVSPFLLILGQCLYDLKVSIFLALVAHYRAAFQQLRPVLENAIAGLWFNTRLQGEEERQSAREEFYQWTEGRFEIPAFGTMVDQLSEHFLLLDKRASEQWRELIQLVHPFYPELTKGRVKSVWHRLSKFLHPYYPVTDIRKEFETEFRTICPARVAWDKKAYREWLILFQNIADIVLRLIVGTCPDVVETEDGKEGLGFIKNLESLESELRLEMIPCSDLRDFAATISFDDLGKEKIEDEEHHPN